MLLQDLTNYTHFQIIYEKRKKIWNAKKRKNKENKLRKETLKDWRKNSQRMYQSESNIEKGKVWKFRIVEKKKQDSIKK